MAFDDDALAEDLERASSGGRAHAVAARREFERRGIDVGRLRPCAAEGPDRTRLAGCVKTYLPWPAGRFGMVRGRPRRGPAGPWATGHTRRTTNAYAASATRGAKAFEHELAMREWVAEHGRSLLVRHAPAGLSCDALLAAGGRAILRR